ncbi:MAG: DUF4157 domain-containing protein [Cytophagales bacterium]|nr:DUF4157 domain-containing protein [Cytophagales bacterium]
MARGIIRRKSIETVVQPKLKVGQPGDKYEQEADAMADRVVSYTAPNAAVQMAPSDEDSVAMKTGEETVNMQAEEEQVAMSREDESQVSMKEDVEVDMMADEEQVAAKEEDKVEMKEDEVSMKEDPEEDSAQVSLKEKDDVSMKKEDDVSMKEDEKVDMMTDEEQVATKEDDEMAMKEDEDVSMKEEEGVDMTKDEEMQMKCASCENEKARMKPAIQTSTGGARHAASDVAQRISQTRGGGMAMSQQTTQEMGQKMGADFSSVRIHKDEQAAQLNSDLGSKAFAVGKDVYFNQGEYNPGTKKGKHLLAHELTHTMQQGAVRNTAPATTGAPGLQQAEDLASSRFSGNRYLETVFDGRSSFSQKRNKKGRHVRLVQQALLAQGYSLPVHGADSDFGQETEEAVRAFQIDHGTAIDGVVGKNTLRLLDMDISGGTVSTGPAPTPVPATAAFSEAANETFAGYDASAAPNWLVVPVNGRRRADVAITPAGTVPTYVSDTPGVATVHTTDDGIVVTGVGVGTANITARNGPTILATLRVSVKAQIDRSVAFHYVSDSRAAAAGGPHSSNGAPSGDEMRSLLNRVWHRQANIRFTDAGFHNVVVPGDLGAAVEWQTALGGGEWHTVTATGTGADYNVFRVWDYLQDGRGTNGGANLGNNTMIADATCGDGWGLPHEAGHYLGLGHGTAFIMTPCGARADQRVSKAQVDTVNP